MKTILTAIVLAAATTTASAQVDIYDLMMLQNSEHAYQEMMAPTYLDNDRPVLDYQTPGDPRYLTDDRYNTYDRGDTGRVNRRYQDLIDRPYSRGD